MESVLNFRRMTGLVDLRECLSLAEDNLPSAVSLSSVHTPQQSSENHGLMGYMVGSLGQLVSILWECKSPQLRRVTEKLDLGECLSLDANNLPPAVYLSPIGTPPTSNYEYFMFMSHKLIFLAVPARNVSEVLRSICTDPTMKLQ